MPSIRFPEHSVWIKRAAQGAQCGPVLLLPGTRDPGGIVRCLCVEVCAKSCCLLLNRSLGGITACWYVQPGVRMLFTFFKAQSTCFILIEFVLGSPQTVWSSKSRLALPWNLITVRNCLSSDTFLDDRTFTLFLDFSFLLLFLLDPKSWTTWESKYFICCYQMPSWAFLLNSNC